MCGICGVFGKHDPAVIRPMADALRHRGPDDDGYFAHRDILSLGHRRLSIIDLTTGKQPIFNEDRSVVVVFNGEIYNYVELRAELEKQGHRFATKTDTEVIAHLFEEHGEEFVSRLNGEYAIALFHVATETLYLIRDRFGIRSIYFHQQGDTLTFASEIKSLLAAGRIEKSLNLDAWNRCLTLRYVPGEQTLFDGIRRIPPGAYLKVNEAGVKEKRYWKLSYEKRSGWSERESVERFRDLFEDSVRLRMRSDVPVGAFLSGGIDSSAIVALARKYAGEMKTFSVGFRSSLDENENARTLAKFLGTTHQDLYVGPDDYREIVSIVRRMDEPIGDFILLPTYFLARSAAQQVKVVLTGEGADEILGGYVHHLALGNLWNMPALTTGPAGAALRAMIRLLPHSLLTRFFPYPAALGAGGKQRLLGLLRDLRSFVPAYLRFAGVFAGEDRRSLLTRDAFRNVGFEYLTGGVPPKLELDSVIDADMNYWLPDYTLLKQDRLSMMNSIEGRVPFLDHRLVEFCAALPPEMKSRFTRTKIILRRAAEELLPPGSAKRKKQAFYIPTEEVFGPGFRAFVRERLLDSRLEKSGLFRPGALESALAQYDNREILSQKRVNLLLIMAIWYEEVFAG